jgi:pimeloyl-ACP methyl ester carboxylesterase
VLGRRYCGELTPPPLSREIAAAIAGYGSSSLRIAGHLSTMERPDAVNGALTEWMAH